MISFLFLPIFFYQDCLYVSLYRSCKDKFRSGDPKKVFSLQEYLGTESGFGHENETNTLAVICKKDVFVFAFETREILSQWKTRLQSHFCRGKDFCTLSSSSKFYFRFFDFSFLQYFRLFHDTQLILSFSLSLFFISYLNFFFFFSLVSYFFYISFTLPLPSYFFLCLFNFSSWVFLISSSFFQFCVHF